MLSCTTPKDLSWTVAHLHSLSIFEVSEYEEGKMGVSVWEQKATTRKLNDY